MVSYANYTGNGLMTQDRRSELAAEFLIYFGAMIRGMDSIFRKEMASYGVTWNQFYMMKVLKRSGKMTVTELSDSLLVATPTASRMIECLCSRGYLEKARDPGDHRVAVITLAPKSDRLLEKMSGWQKEIVRDIFEGEDTDEIEMNVKSFGRYVDRLHCAARARDEEGAQDE